MNKFAYDIDKLSRSGEISAIDALKNFRSEQDYFNMLTEFTEKSAKYLQYTPAVVTYSRDTCDNFLAEAEGIKQDFIRLGMNKTVSVLDGLKEAAKNNDTKKLSDKMVQFRAELEIIKKVIDISRKTSASTQPTILAVDDKPEILTAIINMLQEDYRVIAVTSVKDAMKAIEVNTPDIFLLDIGMPETDGFEMARQIRAKKCFADTPILFLTGKSSKEDVVNALKHGGNDYILKPVNRETLIKRIRHCLKEDD